MDLKIILELIRFITGWKNEARKTDQRFYEKVVAPSCEAADLVFKETKKMYLELRRSLSEYHNNVSTLKADQSPRKKWQVAISSFKQKRIDSQTSRIKLDAEAIALWESFKQRNDSFAKEIKWFCLCLRTIAGRLSDAAAFYKTREENGDLLAKFGDRYSPAFSSEVARNINDISKAWVVNRIYGESLDEKIDNEELFQFCTGQFEQLFKSLSSAIVSLNEANNLLTYTERQIFNIVISKQSG